MCGACGRRTVTDAWTPILAGARARWEEADFVNEALRDGASPDTGHCHSRVIRSTTRQGVVLDTATALWTTLLSRSEVPVDLLLGLPARLHGPIETAALTPVTVARPTPPRRQAAPPCRAVF